MRKMILKNQVLENFMGDKIKCVEYDKNTSILGKNGSGKTTKGTSHTFLYTGKDIYGNDLNPMPKDKDGKRKNNLIASVEETVDIEGVEYKFKRSVIEKYAKDKITVNGYTTKYKINDDDYTATEYNNFLIDLFDAKDYKDFIKMFLVLSSSRYFRKDLSTSEKRKELINMSGEISNSDIINSNQEFAPLAELETDNAIDKREKTVKNQISKLKEEIDEIDPKIQENLRNLPELTNTTQIEAEIKTIDDDIAVEKKELQKFDAIVTKYNNNTSLLFTKRNELMGLKSAIDKNIDAPRLDLESKQSAARSEYRQLNTSLEDKKEELIELKDFVADSSDEVAKMVIDLQKLRDENKETSKKQVKLDDIDCDCPTCKQKLPTENIDTLKAEMVANFDRIKQDAINKVNAKGKALKEKKEALELKIKNTLDVKIPACTELIASIQKSVDESIEKGKKITTELENLETSGFIPTTEYTDLEAVINGIQKEIDDYVAPDKTKVESTISQLEEKKGNLRASMGGKETYDNLIKRNEELSKLHKDKSDDKTRKEGFIDIVKKFRKIKVQMIEESVKSKFKMVSFKLFEDNLNGDGYKDCCDMMVNGITIKDGLNTADVMNGGLDIINTLSNHYNMCLPVFMDRGESNNTPLEIENQLIELRVTKGAFKVAKMD